MPFLGVDPAPGTQQRARIELGEALDGSPITLPVAVLRGSHDGPTVYLQAGLHGDELTGIDICRRALASLDAAALKGTVAVVPLANPPAHRSRSRGWRHEERGPIDANRVFPGAEHGLMTERIVHTLFQEFVAQADLLGKASISAEMGESLRVTRDFVPLGVQGVLNVLCFLGVLDGDPVPPPAPARVFRTITLAHAERGGGLRWRIAHRDDVRAGQPIADIVDVFGDPVATVESPADGFLLRQMLWGTVATGGEIAWVAS